MEYSKDYFEGLPSDLRYWFCKYKSAVGDPYKTPLPLEEVLKKGGTGVCVLTGEYSNGLLLLDEDGYKSDITFQHHFGVSIAKLPPTVSCSSGRPNRKESLYRVPREWWDKVDFQELKLKGCGQIELRWGKHYSLIQGLHPRDKKDVIDEEGNLDEVESKKKLPIGTGDGTGEYKWIKGRSPKDIEIAEAPLWLLQKWAKMEKTPKDSPTDGATDGAKARPFSLKRTKEELLWDSSRVEHTLERYFTPANNYSDYSTWLKVIMSLHSLSKEWEEHSGIKDRHLKDAHTWSSWMNNYDADELNKKWKSFNSEGITIATLFGLAKDHPNWEIDNPPATKETTTKEKPKRKRSELLKDLLDSAIAGTEDDMDKYYEDFAEMQERFKRKPDDINVDLLHKLRDRFSKRTYSVGAIDMSKVKKLQYILEGYLIKGEIHLIYGRLGSGKTSLVGGMVKCGHKKKGFLDQTRHRDSFKTLFIQSDGGASRFLEVYEQLNLTPDMVEVWGGDFAQGKKNFKLDIPGIIQIYERCKEGDIGCIAIDSVKGMLSSSPFSYKDNDQVDVIAQFLREIVLEPLSIGLILLSHMNAQGRDASGAQRWGEVAGSVMEVQPSKCGNGEEDHNSRRLAIWKDPIGGRRFLDYKFQDSVFTPVHSSDIVGDCFSAMRKWVQDINFQTGQSMFTRVDLLKIPNFSRAQIDRTTKEHLLKNGIFKAQKDSNGKVQRGKYLLKSQFKLNKEEPEKEQIELIKTDGIKTSEQYINEMDYWDANPNTLPPTKKMNSKEKIELLQDAMKSEEAKNKLIDI